MQQGSFDFLDERNSPPRAEPPRPNRPPKHHSTGICRYCGERVPGWMLSKTAPVDDKVSWNAQAAAHSPGCRWVVTKGLRLDMPTEKGTP